MGTAVAVKIEDDTKKRLQRLAKTKKRTQHYLMKEAIDQYIEKEEKQEELRRSALEAYQDYQETGLHLTGNEVINWLQTWGNDAETEAPECHE